MLTKKQTIKELNKLIEVKTKCDQEYDKLASVLGNGVLESSFVTSYFDVFDKYMETVSKLIGDDFEWVFWYIYDNDCGKRNFEAGNSKNKMRKIKTTTDLADLIRNKDV